MASSTKSKKKRKKKRSEVGRSRAHSTIKAEFDDFRSWLVSRVSLTAAASTVGDDSLERLSHQMGIEVDVLVEARIMAKERRLSTARAAPMGSKRAGTNHYQVEILLPQEIFDQWHQTAANRGLKGSAMLRSLIHTYLVGSWEPESVASVWEYMGVVYSVPWAETWAKEHGRRYPYRERALITSGARRALIYRAQRLGVTPSRVVRTLMLAAMNREWAHPGSLIIIDAANMYDDEKRYNIGEEEA